MGRILDILTGIGNTLDVPGSMVRDTLGGENPLNQLLAPWRSDNRLSGRDLARRWGLASQEDTWGNLAGGIGLELVTDPLNVVAGAGMLSRLLKGAKIAKATQGVEKANALSQTLRSKGWMPEEVASATKIRQTPQPAKWTIHANDSGLDLYAPSKEVAEQWKTENPSLWGGITRVTPDVAEGGPARVYHETAAPLFEPHQFLPDPGTNNWMGKGTYFTKQPGEAAGNYSTWDKSTTIMPKEPGAYVRTGEPHAIIQAFRQNMPERYFKNITPDLERDLLPEIGATAMEHPQGYPKSLVEALRPMYREARTSPWSVARANDDASNWLKKSHGMTDDELDELGNEELWDMATKAGWTKPPILGDKPANVATEVAKESAPRTMMAFVDSRNPYRFEEPATLKDMLMARRAEKAKEIEQGLPSGIPLLESLRDLKKGKNAWRTDEYLRLDAGLTDYDDEIKLIRSEMNAALESGDTAKATELGQELEKTYKDANAAMSEMASIRERELAANKGASKGDLWALLQSQGKKPDEITDILREAGYDALQHEAGTSSKIQERMYDIGREAPDIDEHSELVAFRPSQIYQPFIAPALKQRPEQLKPIPRSLKALLGGYQAGVVPARGRSAEQP